MEENSEKTVKVRGVPFEKGESGNPNGRPKGQRNFATIYREALIKLATLNGKEPEELENEILSNALLSARKGDYRFYKDLLDRLYGTATNKTDITSQGEKILVLPAELINKNATNPGTETNS